ncbi:FAD/NAD-P-binding domain-containing protein [Desarmillaria tabescens]|uniref:NADH:ubiquinone reductase (non-electrogenic) n=1 Tax=Armillaria tabescens TaxID=1929756 RepID=A0AA39JWW1_ARMTA|nr:FAD/NAD-P-binding domain-containing protein [Desarmillaria tabescens]KAK0450299.1 FAD/NAD-P-binding domain-containing protein [Desarmillaria tabescens]
MLVPLCQTLKFGSIRSTRHLGSGWGGYKVLHSIDRRKWGTTSLSVSPNNYFNFTPLLASACRWDIGISVQHFSPRVIPYQAWCDRIGNKMLECMLATPVSFSSSSQTIVDEKECSQFSCNTPFSLQYDKLVIAVGHILKVTFGIPGVKEHAHFLKDVKDARAIRARVLQCFEQTHQPVVTDADLWKLLNFCIVGGGPTGVELAAELHDLINEDLRTYYPELARLAQINLYDVAPSILGSFDHDLVKYAFSRDIPKTGFTAKKINIWTNHHVERVESNKLFLKEKGEVPFGVLVWSTGLATNPLIESITGVKKHPKTGSLITDHHLNIIESDDSPNPDVWAIGDAAIIEDNHLPATAQVAYQKGAYLARKLNGIARGRQHPEEFQFYNKGMLAYIGNWNAIYGRPKDSDGGKFFIGSPESGRAAWLLWRSAYFTLTLSWKKQVRYCSPVISGIFGRDISCF